MATRGVNAARRASDPRAASTGSGLGLRLTGLLLIVLAFSVPMLRADDRPVEGLVARWGAPPSQFLDLDGQLVHLRDVGARGDPLPVVMLHGIGSSLHVWEGWSRRLAPGRRAIALDLPSAGLTGPWAGAWQGRDPSPEAAAELVFAVLDRLGVRRAVVAGNSLGGAVAVAMARRAPDRVAALVLVDPLIEPLASGEQRRALAWGGHPVFEWFYARLMPRAAVAWNLQQLVGPGHVPSPEAVERTWELLLRSGNRRAVVAQLRWMRDHEPPSTQGLAMPVLLLWGQADRLLPPPSPERVQALLPGARFITFPGLGHLPQEEDPQATWPVLRDFLATMPTLPTQPAAAASR